MYYMVTSFLVDTCVVMAHTYQVRVRSNHACCFANGPLESLWIVQ